MAKKIVVLCGSPRADGNTNTMVGWAAAAAGEQGAEVEVVNVARLKSKTNGCICCMGCQKSDEFRCVIDDEISPVLARAAEADVLVFATPVFFFGPTAQLKILLDRMYCLIKLNPEDGSVRHALTGADIAVISTGGGDLQAGLGMVDATFRTFAEFIGRPYDSLLTPGAQHDPELLKGDGMLQDKAAAFGRTLAGA